MARLPGSTTTIRSQSEGRARMWRAMRVFRSFTSPQVCMAASVSRKNAQSFIRALEKAGYLRRVRAHESGKAGSFADWRLIRDTGPECPILRRDRNSVYDPNTKVVYGGTDATDKPA